jgi:F1F0 ATPase subunit 2
MSFQWTMLLAPLATGVGLGLIFYGGLFFTVRAVVKAKQPALLTVVSFALRTGVVLAGFYWIGAGDWTRIMAALAGFILARIILLRVAAGAGGETELKSHETH